MSGNIEPIPLASDLPISGTNTSSQKGATGSKEKVRF